MVTTLIRYQQRRNTAAQWTASNEVLLVGEAGYETDTGREKLGDGTTGWNGLPYQASAYSDDGIFYPELYGAKADGTTDDGPALTAAYAAASTAAGTAAQTVIRLAPGKTYRVATSVTVARNVALEGRGAIVKGPITAAAPINSGNNPTVPAASDVTGQTAGAAFTDPGTAPINGLRFSGIHLQGYRYGFLTRSLSWAYAVWDSCFFENCNIGVFAYQGAQHYKLIDTYSGGGTPGTTFAAAATGFPTGHPYAGGDNFFCDGFVYDNAGGGRDASAVNPTFDTWFQAAVLRPTTPSITASYPSGYLYPQTDDSINVSGRPVYIPQRNNRISFSPEIRRLDAINSPLGVALIGNPYLADIRNISGEGMFAGGPKSMVTLVANNAGLDLRGICENIDGVYVTNPSLYGVEVRGTAVTRGALELRGVSGNAGSISSNQYQRRYRSATDFLVDPTAMRDGGFPGPTHGSYLGYSGAAGVQPIISGGRLTRTAPTTVGNGTLYFKAQVTGKLQHVRLVIDWPATIGSGETIAVVMGQAPGFPSQPQPPGNYAGIHHLLLSTYATVLGVPNTQLSRIAAAPYGLPVTGAVSQNVDFTNPHFAGTTRTFDLHVNQTTGRIQWFLDGTKVMDYTDTVILPYIGDSVTVEWFDQGDNIPANIKYLSASPSLDPVGNLTQDLYQKVENPRANGYCNIYSGANTVFSTTTVIPCSGGAEISGGDVWSGNVTGGTNTNGGLQILQAGTYLLTARALLQPAGVTGSRDVAITVNGTIVRFVRNTISADWAPDLSVVRRLAVGDVINLQVASNVSTTAAGSGGTLNVGVGAARIA